MNRTACTLLLSAGAFASAQTASQVAIPQAFHAEVLPAMDFAAMTRVEAPAALPDDPGAAFGSSSSSSSNSFSSDSSSSTDESAGDPAGQRSEPATVANKTSLKHSGHLQMTIAPGEVAEPMTNHEKVVGGLKDSFSLFAMAGWFASAGWEQLTNDSPNYGTDSGAFGARLGAAAARSSSESVFAECLFAPIFHEDPRYYVMGRGHNVIHRAVYAATRAIITKTDSGREVPNFALIAGNAGGAALTIPYYPQKNTTFSEVAQTFGGSIGGSAIGYVVTEFLGDALVYAHLRKAEQ